MALKYTAILFTIFLLFVIQNASADIKMMQVAFVETLASKESIICCPKGKSNTASLTVSKTQPGSNLKNVKNNDCTKANDVKVNGEGMGDSVLTAVVIPQDELDQKRASGEAINNDSVGCETPTEFCMQTDSMKSDNNCIVITNVSNMDSQISCDSSMFNQ
ncbi:9319_t:CDS:2 [Funneliformis mosseae]|uniref:9319_t:CDS:1 n=1 Tax=Funneliformis mosseae TaxID=27381 RepID=A0A9N8V3T5_FUNMO|nr:9319_t:CDS:2 [Funneliformis mosseae]